MKPGRPTERDECIEQAHFFRILRDRLEQNHAVQDVLVGISEEILATTRLPMAVQFLATEVKHSGSLGEAFGKLPHYFTPFQAFVMKQAEDEKRKFPFLTALIVLEREAQYKSQTPTPAGLFVYQFETLTRNRLGYDAGLNAMSEEPFFDSDWQTNAEMVRRQVGIVEFAELVYLRSEYYAIDKRRIDPDYISPLPIIFGDKEGRIAKASVGRDPLFLFAALQRQLSYPEVPKPRPKDDTNAKLEQAMQKLREFDTRLRMLEAETRGNFDPTQFGKPDFPPDDV